MSVTTTPRVTTCRGTARVNLDSRETGTQLSFYLPPTNTYGCQADGTHPIGMLSCLKYVIVHATTQWQIRDDQDQKGASTYYLAKCLLKTPHISKKYWTKREGYASLVPLPDSPLQPLRLRTPGDHYILNNNDTM